MRPLVARFQLSYAAAWAETGRAGARKVSGTMHRVLASSVIVFGAICIAIALMHIAIGPACIPGSVPVNATMDSEDRFYATLFAGFGVALIWCGCNLAERRRTFGCLLIVFFAGGLARIVSILSAGPPATLFLFLGGLELALPPLLWFWLRKTYRVIT